MISTMTDPYNHPTGSPIWEWGFLNIYSIMMFLGFVFTFFSILFHWKRMKYPTEILQTFLIIIVPSSLIGARLWYVISEGSGGSFFTFEGLSIQGGVAGAVIGGLPYGYKQRHIIDIRTTLGMIMPNVLLGQALGRWGNFSNHEVYGAVVSGDSLNWMGALKDHMFIDGDYRAPLFFYESMANLAGYIFIVWILLDKGIFKPGSHAALYLIWYGTTRAAMEPFRDSSFIMTLWGMNTSFIMSLLMVVLGVFLFFAWNFFTRPHYRWMKFLRLGDLFETEYVLIKPQRRVKRFGFGKEYMKTYRIWLPAENGQWKIGVSENDKKITKAYKPGKNNSTH